MEDFMKLVDEAALDYEEYRAEYEEMRNKKKKEEEERQKADLSKISKDVEKEGLCFVRKAIRSVQRCFLLYKNDLLYAWKLSGSSELSNL